MVAPENGFGGSTLGGGADISGARCTLGEKADAALMNPLLVAHQSAMGLLLLTEPCRFHECNAQVADQLAGNALFATALATKPGACHATVLRATGCNRVLVAKSLPYFQR